ncbi:hypothetical protein BX666DRAFT_1846928 [Dichotomocladium elegans]|nr:hypothetical protein BX666DRAFT_1846928 [Dichotomocladium elegans]
MILWRLLLTRQRSFSGTVRRHVTTQQQKPAEGAHQQTLRGWRKYAHQFRDKPASYMTTFAILHEVTAIVPLPIVYYALEYSGMHIPLLPDTAVAEGNRIMSKVRTRYGYEPLDPNSRTMVNLATAYAVVKVLMPLRVAASVALTPFFAERFIGPVLGSAKKLLSKN